MLATVSSATLIGVDGRPISVEVHVSRGLPSFTVVGLPDASCREARDRVRAAILSSGLQWPQQRVTVNLAPTGIRKGGAGLDLPIAVALLAADGQIPAESVADVAFLGELGLDGSIRRVPGVLPLVDAIRAGVCRRARLLRPPKRLSFGADAIRTAPGLRTVAAVLRGEESWPSVAGSGRSRERRPGPRPRATCRGQPVGRLAVEVAAAGGHHLLLIGPPGAGKTMLAERLPGLLPPLDTAEALEVDADPFGGRDPLAVGDPGAPSAVPGSASQRLARVADRRGHQSHAARGAELRPPRRPVPRRARRVPCRSCSTPSANRSRKAGYSCAEPGPASCSPPGSCSWRP